MAPRKAGMATGVEVGRISVRVSPDTDHFRKELHDQLTAIEKKENVNLTPDEDDFKRKVNKTVDNATKQVNKGSGVKKIKFDVDTKPINASVDAMRKKMDVLDLRWQKKVMAFRLENIKPKTDFANMRDETNRVMQEFDIANDKARRLNDSITKALNPDAGRFDPRSIRARFRDMFRSSPIELPYTLVENNKGGGGRRGRNGGIAVPPKGMDIPTPSFGTGINPAGYAVILAGISLVAAPLVGIITTALLTLPGLLTAVLAPIGAVTLGMKGIADAAAEAGLTDRVTGKKGKVKTTLGETLKQLQADVSSVFRDKLKPVFTDINDFLGSDGVKTGFQSIAGGLSNMAQGFVTAITSGQGLTSINNALKNIGDGLSKMKPGVQDFATGFAQLIEQFTAKLPNGIADWFNKTGESFKNWVAEWSAVDPATGVSKLSTAFDQLGGFVKRVLDLLGQWGKTGMDFMSKPGSLDGFLAIIKDIGDALDGVLKISAKLNEQWQTLVQIGRGANVITDLTTGNLGGAWNNFKDLITNKPWLDAKDGADGLAASAANARTEVDKLNAATSAGFSAGASIGTSPFMPNNVKLTGGGGDFAMPEPDTSAAVAKLQSYRDEAAGVIETVQQQLNASGSGLELPAPDTSAFKQAFADLPAAVQDASTAITAAVNQWPQIIADVGGVMYANGVASGVQAAQGMAAGITTGIPWITAAAQKAALAAKASAENALGIKSPSRVFMDIGENTGKGMGIGLDKGFGPVLDQAKDMAGKVAAAFADGSDPTGNIAGYSKQEIDRMEKVLGLEIKRLETQAKILDYQAKTTGNSALKTRADEIRQQKEQLGLHKDMLGLTQDYNSEVGGGGDPLVKAASGLMKTPVDFAKATGKQFLSDLGISGDGFISKALTEGMNYVFNIGSVDEALSIKDRETSKQALSIVGR